MSRLRSWRWIIAGLFTVVLISAAGFTWWKFGLESAAALAAVLALIPIVSGPVAWAWHSDRAARVARSSVVARISLLEQSSSQSTTRTVNVTYAAETIGGSAHIYPRVDYLEGIDSGNPLEPLSYQEYPFAISWPTLDVALINDTEHTLVIRGLSLRVADSRADSSLVPVIAQNSRPARTLLLLNEGWGIVRKSSLTYTLQPHGYQGDSNLLKEFRTEIESFSRSYLINISDSLEAAGVEVETLEALRPLRHSFSAQGSEVLVKGGDWISDETHQKLIRAASGPFGEEAIVSGTLSIISLENMREQTALMPFRAAASIFRDAGYYPSYTGSVAEPDIVLRLGAAVAYEVRSTLPVLRPHEMDHVVLRVGSDRSGTFELFAEADYDDGKSIRSARVSLRTFVPRSLQERDWPQWLYVDPLTVA